MHYSDDGIEKIKNLGVYRLMLSLKKVFSWRIITVLFLLVAVAGCTTGDYAYRGYGGGGYDLVDSQSDSYGSSSASYNRTGSDSASVKKIAAMRADVSSLKNTVRELRLRLKENEKILGNIKNRLDSVRNQGIARQQSEQGAVSELRNKIEELESDLEKERRVRRKADKELVNTVSSEVSAALSEIGENRERAGGLKARGTYTVQKGDTLSAISKAFNVTVDELKQINNLKNNLIRVGQKLLIPEK